MMKVIMNDNNNEFMIMMMSTELIDNIQMYKESKSKYTRSTDIISCPGVSNDKKTISKLTTLTGAILTENDQSTVIYTQTLMAI